MVPPNTAQLHPRDFAAPCGSCVHSSRSRAAAIARGAQGLGSRMGVRGVVSSGRRGHGPLRTPVNLYRIQVRLAGMCIDLLE
jgi:hypothetical protein